MTNQDYWLWICNIKDVWHSTIAKILEEFHTPKELYESSDDVITERFRHIHIRNQEKIMKEVIACRGEKKLEELEQFKKILREKHITFVSIEDKEYPEKFRNIKDFPYGFYYRGSIHNIEETCVGIIGARGCSTYGKEMARRIGFELGVNGINVVSGMAKGIDAYGQRGCLEGGGITYGVLGCGVDICYPRENIELYEHIIEKGALISDYPIGSPPLNWQFPLRNRLISALCDKLVLIEARQKSGSLITVNYALEQGKDIYAVPGRIGDCLSEGCNRLIKDGAGIVSSIEDILEDVKISRNYKSEKIIKNNYILEKELEMLYSCVDLFPKSIQQLSDETGLDTGCLMKNLIKLQMNHLIEEPTKNYYIRKM